MNPRHARSVRPPAGVDPDRIVADAGTRLVLDVDRQVALLLLAVPHFVPDCDDPAGLLRRHRDALAPSSHLAITHGTLDDFPGRKRFRSPKATIDQRAAQTTPRSRAAAEALLHGFDLVEPGLVWPSKWRPDPGEKHPPAPGYSEVGRKR